MKKVLALLFVIMSFSAFALDPTQFSVQRVTAPYFVVDGNSPTSGPQSAYVGFKVTNTSSTITYSNLKFTITSVISSVAGQNYLLVSPADGIILIGTLAPGASKVCYYYVSYPANVTPQATFNYSITDLTAFSKTGSSVIPNRSSISANAGGLATQNISNQDLIGGIVYDDVTYTLGNTHSGDENDFQISVSTGFDPTKLILVKTQVTSSTIPGIAANTADQLYFTASSNQSSGSVTIRWTFKISATNFTALILPYAGATSGSTNYKYAISTDLGGGTPIVISSTANPLTITKTSDKTTYGVSTVATFTITVQNPGAYPVTFDKLIDQIPSGFVFQSIDAASGITTSNSTNYPLAGAIGTISFEGGVVSGGNTSYTVPANGSLILKYAAVAPATIASNLQTTAKGYVGTTQFASAQNTVNVSSTLPVTLQSFNAAILNDKVKLDWSTANEQSSSYFEVQRSDGDVAHFAVIGSVDAAQNSMSNKSYSFIDLSTVSSIVYYRLRITDIGGSFKYSPVISLRNDRQLPVLSVHPNPFNNKLQLNLSVSKEQDVEVRLFDNAGYLIKQQTCHCIEGANSCMLNDSEKLSRGIYFFQVNANRKSFTLQVIKN